MAPADVHVQVCGRQENIPVDNLSVQELSNAVELHFEVRPPFLLVDLEGRPLTDDVGLAACVSKGRPIVVKLTEGVMHDVSRRVDQLRHLQWGFISDQLRAVKREVAQQQLDLKSIQAALIQEQSVRDRRHSDLQARMEQVLKREQNSLPLHEHLASKPLSACVSSSNIQDSPEVLAEVMARQAHYEVELDGLRKQLLEYRELPKCQERHGELDGRFTEALETALAAERKARSQQCAEISEEFTRRQGIFSEKPNTPYSSTADIAELSEDMNAMKADLSDVREDVRKGIDVLKAAFLDDLSLIQADIGRDIGALRADFTKCHSDASAARRLAEGAQKLVLEQVRNSSSNRANSEVAVVDDREVPEQQALISET